jgi:phosphate-selective porin OprO/OprP
LFVSVLLGATLPGTALKADEARFDRIWAHAILYENVGDSGLRRLALSGRAQGDWAIFDASGRAQGDWAIFDADEGDFDDVLWRRFRFGFKAQLSEEWVVHLEGDFDLNEGLDGSYERLTDAYFSHTSTSGWELKLLKQSAGFTLDGATSSKRLLTPERNNLTKNLWFTAEYFTGATVSGSCAADVSCEGGVFSSDGNEEFSKFDAGWFSLLSATWKLAAKTGQERLDLTASWVHQDEDENALTPRFTDVWSVVAQWENGAWGIWSDLSFGRGFDAQSDVTGVVIMPIYNIDDRLQWVLRYTWLRSDDVNGIRLGRYENEIVDGTGNEYREGFAGFNWFFYGHKLKWQTGLQFTTMVDDSDTGGNYDGWGVITGLRISW